MKNNSKEKVFTVSEFIDSINNLIRKKVIIQGEIGEKIDRYPRFSFFKLLDKNKEATLPCFVWQSKLEELGVMLKAGIEIKVEGYPVVRPKNGGFNFQVERIGLVGEGALKKAFELLKKKLKEDGFFDMDKKKPIPEFSQKIGVITSKYGKGALPDFKKHLKNFGFEIYFYDIRVEGMTAINDIVEAIQWFNQSGLETDVLVLIRGGGSWESLQAFNSEPVAKAIFASKIPIICGVGHESDETIASCVADVRASTPSIAAKILSEPWELANSQIPTFEGNIVLSMNRQLKIVKDTLLSFEKNIVLSINRKLKTVKEKLLDFEKNFYREILRKIGNNKEKIVGLSNNLNNLFKIYFQKFYQLEKSFLSNLQILKSTTRNYKIRFNQILKVFRYNSKDWIKDIKKLLTQEEKKLGYASPDLKLRQGYTFTFDGLSGKMIRNISQVKIGSKLKTKLYGGGIFSKVEQIIKKNKK